MRIRLSIFTALMVASILTVGLFGAVQARDFFSWVITSRLTVQNATELRGTVTVGGAMDIAEVNVTGGATADTLTTGELALTPGAAISVTTNGAITPTASLQALESAGTVATAGLVTVTATAGDLLTLWNTTDTAITISDTAPLLLAGNAVLGQYDTLQLFFDGTSWIELSRSDN